MASSLEAEVPGLITHPASCLLYLRICPSPSCPLSTHPPVHLSISLSFIQPLVCPPVYHPLHLPVTHLLICPPVCLHLGCHSAADGTLEMQKHMRQAPPWGRDRYR